MNDCSQNLGPRLRYLNNRITQYMDQQFLALDLTSTQSFILHHLSLHENEAVYPKDLEKRFHLIDIAAPRLAESGMCVLLSLIHI